MRALYLNFCPESDKLSYFIKEEKLFSRSQHQFEIVRGSGKETGIPTWKCKYCKQEVKAN